MGECSEFRGWDELIPDALGLIFRNLSLQEILTVVPRVCKSWSRAVSGPYCWKEIDIEDWSRRCKPEQLGQMLRMLVTRSCGSFDKLCVSGLPTDSLFSFIADNAGALKTLELPRSEMSDRIVECVAPKLSSITFLDVSYCTKIGARALEAFGRNCKSLVGLRRTMHPLVVADKTCQDDEASAIARTMPKLRHLEMAYALLTTQGVLEILSCCRSLNFLDLRGCWEVKLDGKLLEERHSGLKVLGPLIVDCYERSSWGECSDCSDSSVYSYSSMYSWGYAQDEDLVSEAGDDEDVDGAWDEQGLEGLEVRFYGGGLNEAFTSFDWPPSP